MAAIAALPPAHAAVNQQEPDKIQSSRDGALMTLVKSAGMAKELGMLGKFFTVD